MTIREYMFPDGIYSGTTEDILIHNGTYDFLNEWEKKISDFETAFQATFGNAEIFDAVLNGVTDRQQMREILASVNDGFFSSHFYEFSKLYKTLSLEYNPIQNYDGHEETETTITPNTTDIVTHTGTDTNTRTDSGEIAHSINGKKMTETTDPRQYTSVASKATDDTTHKTTTYESASTLYPSEGTTTETGERTVTEGYDNKAETVTESYNGYTATDTYNNRKNVSAFEHGETVTTNHTGQHVEKVVFDRAGNIGTMTTQRMIAEERQVAFFNFYSYILQRWIYIFCKGVY